MMRIRLFIVVCVFFLIKTAFSQISSEKFLDGASITGIMSEGGDIWVSTYGQGIYRYSTSQNKWINYSTKLNNSIDNDFFYTIAASNNYVWAGAVDGLYTLDRKKDQWRKRKFALGGEMGDWIRSLCYDPSENILWIGRFQNLTSLDVSKQRYEDHMLTQNNDAKTNTIKVIKLDGDSLIWFGTEAGIFKYRKRMSMNDRDAWQFINNKDGGFLNQGDAVSITDMLFDMGTVWFGTDEFITLKNPVFNVGGIYLYDRRTKWQKISGSDGLPAEGIYCLARTGNKVWAGVYSFDKSEKKDYGRGLVLIDRISLSVTPINLNDISISSSKIVCMYFDGANIWIGTDTGISRVVIENPLAKWTLKKSMPYKKEPLINDKNSNR
jgi:ligand-binding sensor domain-containing protein